MGSAFWHFARRSNWSLVDYLSLLALPLAIVWFLSPQIWPAGDWIVVKRVVVSDAVVGDELVLHVTRDLNQSTRLGSYRVTVRAHPGGVVQCSDGAAVPYSTGTVLDPDEPLDFDWWAFGVSRQCVDWVPEAGEYILETEHCWRRFPVTRLACRAVQSNIFTVRE